MSNDGMMLLTVSGVTPEEFFKRFGEVAQRFGYVLGPAAEAVREAEFNLPEPITIGEGGTAPTSAPRRRVRSAERLASAPDSQRSSIALMAVQAADGEQPKRRVRRTRAQIEADKAAALAKDYLPALPDMEPLPSPTMPPPTIADVKLAGGRLLQASNGDPAKLRALLDHYGVVRMTPLPEEHWAEFISKCDQGGLDDLAL